eukprot:TRINITY_DN63352_c0_g1_i1.p1 TRINITY_DN63352_c0_g1~~TRINITY_DN63352_c0_g1_i1.p1  ORF type:complete len:286 (+),score=37.55 TRINITY_DN63352_c0_g1_i1:52-858(+)
MSLQDRSQSGRDTGTVVKSSSSEDAFVNEVSSLLSQVSFGSLAGYAAGVAFRFASRIALVTVGSAFCFVQALAYTGYIHVNWRAIQRDATAMIDLDRDGTVSQADLKAWYKRTMDCLLFNLPASAGFTGAFLFGATGHARAGAAVTTAGIATHAATKAAAIHILPRIGAGALALPGAPVAVMWLGESLGLREDPTEEEIRRRARDMDAERLAILRAELEERKRSAVRVERQERIERLIGVVDGARSRVERLEFAGQPLWYRLTHRRPV